MNTFRNHSSDKKGMEIHEKGTLTHITSIYKALSSHILYCDVCTFNAFLI